MLKTMAQFFEEKGPWTMQSMFENCALNEKVIKIYTSMNDFFKMARNPSKQELNVVIEDTDCEYKNYEFNLRGLITNSGDLYVWNAHYMTHDQMIKHLLNVEHIEDTFMFHCIVCKDHIALYSKKELSNEEKLKMFDNKNLVALYGNDLNIDFDTY